MSPLISTIANASGKGYGLFSAAGGSPYWLGLGLGSGYGTAAGAKESVSYLSSYSAMSQVSSTGEINWTRMLTGMGGTGYTLAQDGSGNAFGMGGNGCHIWKVDQAGNIVWQRKYYTSGTINGLGTTSSGVVAAAGYYSSGGNDYSVVFKVNADGSLAWAKNLSLTGQGVGAAVDSSGNVWACGYDTQTSSNPFGSWVVKFDTNGNQQWSWRLVPTPAGFIYAKNVVVDSSGNAYVSGWDGGSGNWLLKFNSSGSLQWQKTMTKTNANAYNAYGTVSIGGSGSIYLNDYGEGFTKFDQSGTQLLSRKVETAPGTLVNGWLASSASSDDMVQLMGTQGALKVNGDGSKTGTYPGVIYSAGSYTANPGGMSFSSNYYNFGNIGFSTTVTTYAVNTTKASMTVSPIG